MFAATMNHSFMQARTRLRGGKIHAVYAFLRYTLPYVLYRRIYLNLKLGHYRKVRNYLVYIFRSMTSELPRRISIDVVSVCNMRCPLCSVPPEITAKINPDKNFIPMERFRKILANLEGMVADVSLVYAGEPTLHPRYGEIVKETSANYFTQCITNATRLSRQHDAIFNNLDYLQISFDGFNKESYEKYRVGGDFETVKDNIVAFLKDKRAAKADLPYVAMTYIVHAYNESEREIAQCRSFFEEAGIDSFRLKHINLNVHRREDGAVAEDLQHWLPQDRSKSMYEPDTNMVKFKKRSKYCKICLVPIIRIDGEVLLCCHDIHGTVKLGNVYETPFREIWFSDKSVKIRKLARERQLKICETCGL